jgi:hypothetical protein
MDRSMTRYRHDINKMVENNEISTGPGRWSLGVPNAYGNAIYASEPTVRLQKWGAAHDMTSTKTDVESDLWNLARPTTRVVCGQFNPLTEKSRILTPMTEGSFPETHARLVDPPCTLRATGYNRWSWLYQNPQENVAIPFEWGIDSRHANKDSMKKNIEEMKRAAPIPFPNGIPVPRQPRIGDPQDFTDMIPGSSQRMDHTPVYVEAQRGAIKEGSLIMNPVPRGSQTTEHVRAKTGRVDTPQWFGKD